MSLGSLLESGPCAQLLPGLGGTLPILAQRLPVLVSGHLVRAARLSLVRLVCLSLVDVLLRRACVSLPAGGDTKNRYTLIAALFLGSVSGTTGLRVAGCNGGAP